MKHTPGPWTVGVYDATDNFRSIKQHSCVCDPETMALIAVTGEAHDRQSQVDADLIAAAPDLLEACKVAYDAIEKIPIDILGWGSDPSVGEWPLRDELLHNIAKAISNAKGGG